MSCWIIAIGRHTRMLFCQSADIVSNISMLFNNSVNVVNNFQCENRGVTTGQSHVAGFSDFLWSYSQRFSTGFFLRSCGSIF